jgi:hypothetical protein
VPPRLMGCPVDLNRQVPGRMGGSVGYGRDGRIGESVDDLGPATQATGCHRESKDTAHPTAINPSPQTI